MRHFQPLTIIYFLTILLSFFAINIGYAQKFKAQFEIKNYTNDTLIIGNFFGEKQLVVDTLYAISKGKFIWRLDSIPKVGVYLALTKPDNTFNQFLVNGDDIDFTIMLDKNDMSSAKIKGSKDNTLLYDYMDFLGDKKILADTLRAQLDRAKAIGSGEEAVQSNLDKLDKDVKAEQERIISNFPKTLTSLLLKSNKEIDIPNFEGEEQDVRVKKYYYYKDHYFDNIDFLHPALIRTPFIFQKIDYFINKVTSQMPDSIAIALDIVLEKLEGNEEAYRYFLADFLNKYAQMKVVGYDALYVHLIDKYYKKGKASWVSEENLKKMSDNADDLRPILIGKKMPDIVTYSQDNKPVKLHNIQSPFTVVFFWAPDCGHCKKITPLVVDFYKKNKDKGVTLLSICTKGGDKLKTCWEAVTEKGMQDFLNTADEYQRFNSKVKIKSTPKIFILDENKEILIKDIPAEELDRIFNEILKVEENKKAAKLK